MAHSPEELAELKRAIYEKVKPRRRKFIDKIISIASGEEARNEENGYREISIFKNGVTL